MSFPPNHHYQQGAGVHLPPKNNLQDNLTNRNDSHNISSGIAVNSGGNDWFMQQNWQQPPQHYNQQQPPPQTNFFDNSGAGVPSQPPPIQTVNNNPEQNATDGWGDWDDWNQNESKSSVQAPSSQQIAAAQSFHHDVVEDSFKSTEHWQWGQQQQPLQHQNPPPLPQSPTTWQSLNRQVPVQAENPQIPTLPVQQPSVTVPHMPLPTVTPPLKRTDQLTANSGNNFSNSLTPQISMLVPSVVDPVNSENQETIPENVENFAGSIQPQISLPNSRLTIDESKSYIAPAPQMFQNESHTKSEAMPIQSDFSLNADPGLFNNEKTIIQPNSSTSTIQQNVDNILPEPSLNAIQSDQQHAVLNTFVSTVPVQPLENREQFLNQENSNNERDLFLNQSTRSENLLPPPVAYQQQSTVNDDRNQYLQTSHLSEDDFVVLNNPSNDDDVNLPPPGLSRFVLGEPEQTADSERHADGEDDDAIQPPPIAISSDTSRNVYSFPSPIDIQVQRVVTGVESMTVSQPPVITLSQQVESREIDLDGENLEDQINKATREEPTIGGDMPSNEPLKEIPPPTNKSEIKDFSNSSTANDSDHHHRRDTKKYSSRSGKGRNRYDGSDDSEGSSEREKQRHKEKDRKRKDMHKESDDEGSYRQRESKIREDKSRRNRYDDSRYETEESSRYERSGKRNERKDRDRKYDDEMKRGSNHRRSYRAGERSERRSDREIRERSDRERNYEDENRDRRRRSDQKYHRNYDDSYQQYNRKNNSSRNARDSDYEKDPRYNRHRYNMYGGFDYDPYAYYHQHQQYFEQLRRTNPQSYAEWYRKYYSQMQGGESISGADCRESVHSGRSSAAGHDKDRYSYHRPYIMNESSNMSTTLNSTMIDDHLNPLAFKLNGGPSHGNLSQIDRLTTGGEGGYYGKTGRYYVHSEYSENLRPENMSNLEGRSNIQESVQAEDDLQPGRLTPYKFSNDHAVLSLISGVLVTVKPKYSHSNGLQNIVKLLKVSPNDSTKKLFQSFPGPLVKGITHKKTVIEYCEERIKLGPVNSNKQRSYQSSSNSLQSLSSQPANQPSYVLLWNLLVLLLRQNGVVVGTDIAELLVKNQKLFPYESHSKRNSINSIEKELKESNESNTSEIEEGEITESNQVSGESSDEKSKLTDDEVTDKFRNYLLYGNVKEALEWATDNNLWGHALFLASKVDRRLHANVMMKFANKLQLNDPLQTLYQLMSGRCPSSVTNVQDEKWGDWRPHLAMIISNTTQSPELNRKAITSLGDSLMNRGDLFAAQFCYLMAQVGFGKYSSVGDAMTSNNINRLVLLGSSHVKSNTFLEFATNEAIIMTEIYEYACSLNDENFSIIEFQPYKLLLSCRLLDYGFHLKALMYLEQISIHIQKNSSRYEASFIEKVYDLANKLKFYDPVMDGVSSQEGDFEDQIWLQNLRTLHESNQVPSDHQYSGDSLAYSEQLQNQPYNDYNSYQENITTDNLHNQVPEINQSENLHQQPIQYQQEQSYVASNTDGPEIDNNYNNYYQPVNSTEVQQEGSQQQFVQQQTYGNQDHFQPDQTQTAFTGSYDYYNQNVPSQQYQEPTMPSISMPNSGSGPKRSIFDDEDSARASTQENQKEGSKPDNKKIPSQQQSQPQKQGNASSQNAGWFGGIWNKFSGKPKNQMILPDDKNPTIVWDAEKKKWINTDEGEDSQENFAPPPKMADLVPQLQQLQQQQQIQPQLNPTQQPHIIQPQSATLQSQSGGITDPMAPIPIADTQVQTQTKSSGLQSNMFKIQRNRTLKKSYVDVFNPSGASTKTSENIMAPSLPPLPSTGFMVPSDGNNSQNQPQGTSQFYDPNTYAGNYQQ